jgi:predicted TIM-barrel fold metal-dependent hydrolase
MTRRKFFRTAALIAAAHGVLVGKANAAKPSSRAANRRAFIDTNVSLSRWPFRRLPLDETSKLVAKLRHHGVTQAWAGTFEGLLHKDIASANARLAEECRKHGKDLFVPFGSINLKLADWEEDLRVCQEVHEMPGIRLHPNYHGYKLDEPLFAKLIGLAGERSLVVQLAVRLEDERTQHPLAKVAPVDVTPLPDLLKVAPKTKLVLLNWGGSIKGELLKKLSSSGRIFFDIATLENVGGVASLFQQVQQERIVFGSHAPFFYFESAALKLKESALSERQNEVIRGANATALLQGS